MPVGMVCSHLLERMTPPGGYTDDVVLVAVRPNHSTGDSFATVEPAALDQVPQMRQQLRRWLAAAGVEPSRQYDILLAVGEAVTNAIEHGSHSDSGRTVAIEAFSRGQSVAATVTDSGEWSTDSSASHREARRGRGLTLINGLADHVDTVRTTQGTSITMEFDRVVAGAVG